MERLFLDALVTGLPYVPVALGIFLVFRVRPDFDLTVEGSFALGGAMTAAAILTGLPAPASMVIAVLCSGTLGLVTGLLHVALRIPVILAGLIVSLGVFSVNLRIMGSPALSLLTADTIFSGPRHLDPPWADLSAIGIQTALVGVITVASVRLLTAEVGLALRATGANPVVARSHGVNERAIQRANLFAGNALAGLGASIVVQGQAFATVDAGAGVLIGGLAAVLLGETLSRSLPGYAVRVAAAVIVGTLVYRFLLVSALRIGVEPSDLRLVSAMILIGALALRRLVQEAHRSTGRVPPGRR